MKDIITQVFSGISAGILVSPIWVPEISTELIMCGCGLLLLIIIRVIINGEEYDATTE